MRVLIIDDDETALLIASRRLRARGHVVETRAEAIGTTNVVRSFRPDVVVLDLSMPALGGARLAELIQKAGLDASLVLYSSLEPEALAAEAKRLGAQAFVHKSRAADLVDVVEALADGG